MADCRSTHVQETEETGRGMSTVAADDVNCWG